MEFNIESYPNSEKERKFPHGHLFMSSIKREIKHFHAVVVQWRQRNTKTLAHVQSCKFAYSTYCSFMSLLPRSLTDFEVPINSTGCLLISGKYDAISLLNFQNETNSFVCFLSQFLCGVIWVFMPSVKLKVECKVTAIQDLQ